MNKKVIVAFVLTSLISSAILCSFRPILSKYKPYNDWLLRDIVFSDICIIEDSKPICGLVRHKKDGRDVEIIILKLEVGQYACIYGKVREVFSELQDSFNDPKSRSGCETYYFGSDAEIEQLAVMKSMKEDVRICRELNQRYSEVGNDVQWTKILLQATMFNASTPLEAVRVAQGKRHDSPKE